MAPAIPTSLNKDPVRHDVIVVGAGLIGSLWALMLAKRGHKVRMFESRPDMRRADISAGRSINLALSDRGLRALDLGGAGDAIRKDAIPMRGRLIHEPTGATNLQPYGEEGQHINSVSRGGLNCTLMDLAEAHDDVTITFEREVAGVTFGEPGPVGESKRPSLVVKSPDGTTEELSADYIFGTDGAFSAVRMSMLYTERFNYRIDWLEHGYKELEIPAGPDGSFLVEKNALHIWPRGHFMLIALPNPDASFTCTLFLPFADDKGDGASFDALQGPAEVRALFEREFKDALELMPTLEEDFAKNPTGSLGTVRCSPWTRQGKVCLLGDAAHAIVPFYGQGMNAGFEDCTVLNACLDAAGGDFSQAMVQFERDRKPNADAIADLALYNFIEMRDRVADPRFVLQKKIEKKISRFYGERYTPLYSMVTFSHRPYAEAWRYGQDQEELMRSILALPDIESRWDSEELEPELRKRVDAFLAARD